MDHRGCRSDFEVADRLFQTDRAFKVAHWGARRRIWTCKDADWFDETDGSRNVTDCRSKLLLFEACGKVIEAHG